MFSPVISVISPAATLSPFCQSGSHVTFALDWAWRIKYLSAICLFSAVVFLHIRDHPGRGTADAEIKDPPDGNPWLARAIKGSFFLGNRVRIYLFRAVLVGRTWLYLLYSFCRLPDLFNFTSSQMSPILNSGMCHKWSESWFYLWTCVHFWLRPARMTLDFTVDWA